MPGSCPTIERLAAALRGRQRDGKDAELAAHISECPVCQAQLEALAGGSGWLEAKAKTHATTAPPASDSLKQTIAVLESHGPSSAGEQPASPLKLDFLQPSDQPGVLGLFGPYEVIAHVASGGMGIVLKARDPALDRIVALKILPPALAANALARARFVREARTAAAVVHEHVVPIYAVDECAGLPYLVMQFVHGRSLSERIRASGSLQLEEILRIGAQTAAGLAAAHAQGLIHRDVKPGNILLENSVERVKLTDFGLARAVDDAGLTRTGELAGTPEFMAPEQASNEAVDHRADLFSLGSVLYAMCTGISPFQGSSVVAVIRNLCDKQPPPVHELNPAIPRWLSDIVVRLMAKAPAERFQSAEEIRELLERYLARVQRGELAGLPGSAKRAWADPRPRRRIAIGAMAGFAIVAALLFALKDRPDRLSHSSLGRPLPELFVVRAQAGSSLGGFTRIEDAIAAAPHDGVIELCWTDVRDIDSVKLPPKPLTLRAGRGFKPVWNSTGDSAVALFASAALTLEGIRFEMPALAAQRGPPVRHEFEPHVPRNPASGRAIICVTNGPLRITHCTFDARSPSTTEPACIILANVSACTIENSLLFAPPAKALVWQQNANLDSAARAPQLTLTNCIAVAGQVFWLDLRESSRARMEIARCTFYGAETFYIAASLAVTKLEVNAFQNVFDTDRVIFEARNPALPPLQQWVRWREQENLYGTARYAESHYITGVAIPDGPSRLRHWHEFWNQSPVYSRQVQITYANTNSNMKLARLRLVSPEPGSFQIMDLQLVAGVALSRDEWARFGANTANVGPR
jgi:hypothetical protein